MRRNLFLIVTLAVVLAFTMAFVACSYDPESGSGSGGNNTGGKQTTEIDRIKAYLSSQSGGTSEYSPIDLVVNLQLTHENWNALINAIEESRKYVNLDLSACTRSRQTDGDGLRADGTLANTKTRLSTLYGQLVSLIFPDAAESTSGRFGSSYKLLRSVSGSSITSIGDYAFLYPDSPSDRSRLISASFPKATSIGDGAFDACINLTSVDIPNATSIGNRAFNHCRSLTNVSFPETTSIGDTAFYVCDSLTSVSFPKVTSIGDSAFYNCTKLTSVDIPEGTPYGKGAFYHCPWQPSW